MKKALSILLTVVLIAVVAIVPAYAANYDQPFDAGTLGVGKYRIPALYTLSDGSVLAVADMRYEHGSDSPHNIDIAVAKSKDGYTDWKYQVINHFDDYADGQTGKDSASFIDSAIAQSSNGRVFIVSDAFPSGGGYPTAKTGTGFDKNGHLRLTTGSTSDKLDSFGYYVGDFSGSMATVYENNGTATQYSVDKEYNLYKNGAALYMEQKGSQGTMVQQNVFYNDSELCCYMTTYLWMRYSDDNGETWSTPVMLSSQVKSNDESFLGIGPGRGISVKLPGGGERIIFAVYDNVGGLISSQSENVSTIYSDDNGVTWHRGSETECRYVVGKTSEAQIVDLGNGTLRMFARNNYNYVSYADSTDYGVSWSKFRCDESLSANGNCMVSFINTDKVIDGKKVILGSFASNSAERADGVIKTGLLNADNTISWTETYHLTDGFYAYSCLTQLSDGNFAILFEDEAAHIQYMVLSMDENGKLTEVNNNNLSFSGELSFLDKLRSFFFKIFDAIFAALGIM